MPERKTLDRAEKDKRRGLSPSTQAGEFIREEIHHVRQGKHGVRSAAQAIAIGLSKARKAGVALPPYKRQKSPAAKGGHIHKPKVASPTRSRAVTNVLEHEPHVAASHEALSRQTHKSAWRRGHANLSAAARKAVRTKGPARRSAAARKAARTRAARA